MKRQLVSIIIPAFNAERWIAHAIESALAQTWPEREVIVIDDGSTDSTLEVAKRYQGPTVLIRQQRNSGVSTARNIGYSLAQGDYIQWLDADDVLDTQKVRAQMRVLDDSPPGSVATGAFGAFFYRPKRTVLVNNVLCRDLAPLEWIRLRFAEDAWIALHSWLIHRDVAELAGPWHTGLMLDEDGEYLTRVVAASSGVRYVASSVSFYRRGLSASLSEDRCRAAVCSLLEATRLSIDTVRALNDDHRTRLACARFVQHRANFYCAGKQECWDGFRRLAVELSSDIVETDSNWRMRLARQLIGRGNALRLRRTVASARVAVGRAVDWCGYIAGL